MPIKRRTVLYFLACATGWPVVKGGAASAERPEKDFAGEAIADGLQTPAHGDSPASESAAVERVPAERVLGIGGLFFRAHDPKGLAEWYRSHLGVGLTPSGAKAEAWHTEAGTTAFQPFSLTSKYMGDPQQMWMVNFRVRDLDKMAAQLRAAGVEVTVDPQAYPYGRFARLHDPEQNPIELWEPVRGDAAS
ncbi:MAG TPA: VOC family protein [Terracidiphilus sp.]|jgi:predicted enzyme related to lactoylglutathione lyase|nr:VOC family protein [Terracidiphilus sp.]